MFLQRNHFPVRLRSHCSVDIRLASNAQCVATFAVSPFRPMTQIAKYLPTSMFGHIPIQRRLLQSFCLNGESDDALLDNAAAVFGLVPAATIQNRLQFLCGIDMTPLFPRIATRVLYLQAMRHRIVSPRLSRALTEGLVGSTVQEIDGP